MTNTHDDNNVVPINPSERSGGDRARARGPVTDAERQQMRDMARQGKSVGDIARELQRSKSTVSKAVSDVAIERREQTANAAAQRSVTYAERRAKLKDQTAQATQHSLRRWLEVLDGDHRGSADQAKAFSALVGALDKLEIMESRSAVAGHADVDQWVAAMSGNPSAQAEQYVQQLGDDEGDGEPE